MVTWMCYGWKNFKEDIISRFAGAIFTTLLPPIHIITLWYFWSQYSRRVDKINCSCSCWDTVFKGTYESGIASYKHFYFNATNNTFKIWLIASCGILILYETLRHLVKLMLRHKLRYSMAILFLSSIFPHYYSWWIYMNYYNDEFYSQWLHQTFFTITELLSTIYVIHLANKDTCVTSRKVLLIVGIALIHIFSSAGDQFVFNVIRGQGYSHQIVRDLSFMVPDILHLLLPIWLLRHTRRKYVSLIGPRPYWYDVHLRRDIALTLILVSFGVLFCSWLHDDSIKESQKH